MAKKKHEYLSTWVGIVFYGLKVFILNFLIITYFSETNLNLDH